MNYDATDFYGAIYWYYTTNVPKAAEESIYVWPMSESRPWELSLGGIGRSARFHFSNMEGFYNHLRRIKNPMSEAYMVFCIVQSLHSEYSPYVFKFIETYKEPTLVEIYEVMCKAGDYLRINPHDKTNNHKANDKENDEQVTRRTNGFFYEPVTKKRTTFPKCYYCRKPGHKIGNCFEYIRDLKIAKRERELKEEDTPCRCDDYCLTSTSKEDAPEASSKA
ncbi:hypothetical protein Tco_1293399 [Tanacetum coccineum]